MKVLVTGTAGFIGYHLANALVDLGYQVVGLDNLNDYYDVNLKYARLSHAGINTADIDWHTEVKSTKYKHYSFIRASLEDKEIIMEVCKQYQFDVVVNMAAQAGVRYSITNPDTYVQSNLVGFFNILEACRHTGVGHLVYASSSSVYGLNEQIPFTVTQSVNHPISLYAATKKANELMAHTYSHLYQLPTTGLRFFTVYGPWGRPDMACYLFADAIMKGKPIQVFNHGEMMRDFTYVDDIVSGIINVVEKPASSAREWTGKHPNPSTSSAPYRLYNIGNNHPVKLMNFIRELEKQMGKKAMIEMKEMQPGDVLATWANVDDMISQFKYRPETSIQAGIKKFVAWFKTYYEKTEVPVEVVHEQAMLG
jgi:UDP-glucuronate 4-epimerase